MATVGSGSVVRERRLVRCGRARRVHGLEMAGRDRAGSPLRATVLHGLAVWAWIPARRQTLAPGFAGPR